MTRAAVATGKWYISPAAARALQEQLRGQAECRDRLDEVRYVAGVDCAFKRQGRLTRAAAVVLRFPELTLQEYAVVEQATDFPYVPGLLSFREVPALLKAIAKLEQKPDLILCDGQGYAHPRRFGLACHLGVASGIACIGVAKSRLVGEYREPGRKAGSHTALNDGSEVIGTVLRTKSGVKPLFVSCGHRVSLDCAVDYVLRCTRGYRLPETTRWADGLAGDPAFRLPARKGREGRAAKQIG